MKNSIAIANNKEYYFFPLPVFFTNACILSRDYGTIQMSKRGYEVMLVRDSIRGMESKETKPTLSQTTGVILSLEMFGQYSITSEGMIAGLPKKKRMMPFGLEFLERD